MEQAMEQLLCKACACQQQALHGSHIKSFTAEHGDTRGTW